MKPLPGIRVVALLVILAFSAVSQGQETRSMKELETGVRQSVEDFQKSETSEKRIDALQRIIPLLEQMTQEKFKNDPQLLVGSSLENATLQQFEDFQISVRQTIHSHRFRISQLYLGLNNFEECGKSLEKAVQESELLHGKEEFSTIKYGLHLKLANWLRGATETDLEKWNSAMAEKSKAVNAYQQQDFATASELLGGAIEDLESLELIDSVPYGEAIANYAEVLLNLKRFEQSEKTFAQAIEVNDRLFQKKGSVNANMRRSYSMVYAEQGNHDRAIEILDEAILLYGQIGMRESFDCAVSIFMKGRSLQQSSQFVPATRVYYSAVRIMIDIGDDRLFASLQSDIYECYMASCEAKEPSLVVAEQAVEFANSVFPDDLKEAGNLLLTIAKTKKEKNQLEDCLAIYEQTELMLKSQPDYLATSIYQACVSDLVAMHSEAGNFVKAILYAQEVARYEAKTNGEGSVAHLRKLVSVGILYKRDENFEEAERVFAQIDGPLKEAVGESDPTYLNLLRARADNLQTAGLWDEAIEKWKVLETLVKDNPEISLSFRKAILSAMAAGYSKTDQTDLYQEYLQKLNALEK